jgi:hypothetical protein
MELFRKQLWDILYVESVHADTSQIEISTILRESALLRNALFPMFMLLLVR